jgi:hypothetical protein
MVDRCQLGAREPSFDGDGNQAQSTKAGEQHQVCPHSDASAGDESRLMSRSTQLSTAGAV